MIFTAESVNAILAGRKTQTRRVIKEPLCFGVNHTPLKVNGLDPLLCPHGKPGDRLWVRETWWQVPEPSLRELRDGAFTWPKSRVAYDADESDIEREHNRAMGWKLRPSIFMPRRASRLTLEIESVRVQRLQEISHEDAIAEGCQGYDWQPSSPYIVGPHTDSGELPVEEFQHLWDSINSKRGYGWSVNPFVWAISFRRIDQRALEGAA